MDFENRSLFKGCESYDLQTIQSHPLLWRTTLSILLQHPLAKTDLLRKMAGDFHRELAGFTALTTQELAWEIRLHSKKKAKEGQALYTPNLRKFIKQVVAIIYSLCPELPTTELFFTCAAIYKEITRHFFQLEMLSPFKLYASLKQQMTLRSYAYGENARLPLIQKAIATLFCIGDIQEMDMDRVVQAYHNKCKEWKSLPSFSEFDPRDWEELIWGTALENLHLKNGGRKITHGRAFLLQILGEIDHLLPGSNALELYGHIQRVQEQLTPLGNQPREVFVEAVMATRALLLQQEGELLEDLALLAVFQKNTREVLRFSQNLDSTIHYVNFAYREIQRLPRVPLVEFRKTLSHCSRGQSDENQGKLTLYDPLKTFIDRVLREIYESHPNISESTLNKEMLKAYETALSLPLLTADDLELKILAGLYHYVITHPLHNTLRPITLGICFKSTPIN